MYFLWPSKHGDYLIKSDYWLGKLDPNSIHGSFQGAQSSKVWNNVWNIEGPPKLKHFLWRACKNSLAVNQIRFNRHLATSPGCALCSAVSECIIMRFVRVLPL